MNRRHFLQFLGAIAGSAALPSFAGHLAPNVARVNDFGQPVAKWLRFKCDPLPPGKQCFNAMCTWVVDGVRQRKGLFVGEIKSTGGETEIWVAAGQHDEEYTEPHLGAITIEIPKTPYRVNFTDEWPAFGELNRGVPIKNE